MTCHYGRELKRLSGASVTVRVEVGDAREHEEPACNGE
jgi:hypothetical protein